MTEHILKVWPEYFRSLELEHKTFEVRRDDRVPRYAEGDVLVLREWHPTGEVFTGREMRRVVTYKAVPGANIPLPSGWCVLAIKATGEAPGVVQRGIIDDAVSSGPDGRRAVYLAQCHGVFQGENLQVMFADEVKANRYRDAMVEEDRAAIAMGQAPSDFQTWRVRPVRVSRASWGVDV